MELIAHRINTVAELGKVDHEYGVEIDVRSYDNQLVLHHDPFNKGEIFEEWLKFYRHGTLVVNIKEEGLESSIIQMLDEFSITNFFFLDQSFPFIMKYARLGETRCAVRVSDIESPQTAFLLAGQISWVWCDIFNDLSLDPFHLRELKSKGFRICYVSPELHGTRYLSDIEKLQGWLIKHNISPDAVCTKRADLWKHIDFRCS